MTTLRPAMFACDAILQMQRLLLYVCQIYNWNDDGKGKKMYLILNC